MPTTVISRQQISAGWILKTGEYIMSARLAGLGKCRLVYPHCSTRLSHEVTSLHLSCLIGRGRTSSQAIF
jgi:hypothetical protein